MSKSTTPAAPAWTRLSPSVFVAGSTNARDAANQEAKSNGIPFERAVIPSLSSTPPKLIILVTWMSAQASHINKYILGYQARYPGSRILVVRSSPEDILTRFTSTQRRRVAPAVSTIRATCSLAATTRDPEVILHVFSNGGSQQTRNLLLAYHETTTDPFPPHITIFDSCPGRTTFMRSVFALSAGLPPFPPLRLILTIFVYLIVSTYWLVFVPLSIPDVIERIRVFLNDRAQMKGETKRCYIYSDTDPMVGWEHVEEHGHDAEAKGFNVRLEKFEGTGHCAHLKLGGGTRYWGIVDEMWRGRGTC